MVVAGPAGAAGASTGAGACVTRGRAAATWVGTVAGTGAAVAVAAAVAAGATAAAGCGAWLPPREALPIRKPTSRQPITTAGVAHLGRRRGGTAVALGSPGAGHDPAPVAWVGHGAVAVGPAVVAGAVASSLRSVMSLPVVMAR